MPTAATGTPVASATEPQSKVGAEPGPNSAWFADPTGRYQYRYWSGAAWTGHVATNGVQSIDPDPPHQSATTTAHAGVSPRSIPADGSRGANPGGVVAIIGAAVLAVGSLLPWAEVNAGLLERKVNGTEGDGVITLVIAILVGLVAALGLLKREVAGAAVTVVLLGGVAAGGVAIYDTANVSDAAKRAEDISSLVTAKVGGGLYVCIVGAVVVVVGALLANAKKARGDLRVNS
jgi:hypothetical protein